MFDEGVLGDDVWVEAFKCGVEVSDAVLGKEADEVQAADGVFTLGGW